MILDVNVLLYATNTSSMHHQKCSDWLRRAFNGRSRVGLPWQTIGAFLRIATHPRVSAHPLTTAQAWSLIDGWLQAPVYWVPTATERTASILGSLVAGQELRGNLVTDAQLAAIAIEHGVAVVSADSDLARFRNLHWINPVTT